MKREIVAVYRLQDGRYQTLRHAADERLSTLSGLGTWLLNQLPPYSSLVSWRIEHSQWKPEEIVMIRVGAQRLHPAGFIDNAKNAGVASKRSTIGA